ncbi:MAG: TIGR03905 family TSCPD domain-containing protein [Clostridiales bacterium]|nr:TIGR03905 family TSCPD domain-containing protein [Clostridiales bacterium]
MKYQYRISGVCADLIEFELESGKVSGVMFHGGCHGNHQGIASLVEGADASEVIKRLSGIRCGMRSTSCPDKLAQVLSDALEKEDDGDE